jgi:putative endonuclease
MKEHRYYVYMVTNATRLLYIGMCSRLEIRIWQHKNKRFEGFTSNWKVCRLVYYERYQYVGKALAREKQLKGWRREKKIKLIQSLNPNWHDLSDGWYDSVEAKANALSLDLG